MSQLIGYASIYYANFVFMGTLTLQNTHNRKRGTPLIGYAKNISP